MERENMEAIARAAAQQEKIASREQHEPMIATIVDRLREAGYVREGESIELSYPTAETVVEWLIKGELPAGVGKAIAKCDATCLTNPLEKRPADAPADPLHDSFVAAGYHLEACPNFEAMDADHDAMTYLLYEKKAVDEAKQ